MSWRQTQQEKMFLNPKSNLMGRLLEIKFYSTKDLRCYDVIVENQEKIETLSFL